MSVYPQNHADHPHSVRRVKEFLVYHLAILDLKIVNYLTEYLIACVTDNLYDFIWLMNNIFPIY